ncbi:MAG TPA: hypothetical protein VGN42_14040 [Pirellulales bacterium]|nr:hypothetical protein [Pirellulales bacterium]
MAIDPYALCPGGTGKKVKFCCPDLLGELEKIQRMLSGDQRQACLDYLGQLEAKFPDRACLLTTKALLQGQLGEPEAARQTVDKVLLSQPENPVALAEAALLTIDSQGAQAAVEPLQRAIAASNGKLPGKVFEVIGILAQGLVAEGHLIAALAHAGFQLRISPKSEDALQLIVQLSTSRLVPLLFKDMPRPFDEGPVEAPLKADFDAALDAGRRFQWRDAAERFARLAERAPNSAAVWRNLGLLRAYLADEQGAAAALHHYAALAVPLDDAVEAEALAQMLDPQRGEEIDLVFFERPINDVDQLTARLSSSRQVQQLAPEELAWDDPEQPPPRASFCLLDRPMPATGAGLAIADVPETLAQLFLFGRETDRAARLEISVYRDQLAAADKQLAELVGDTLGPAGAEEVISSAPALQRVLSRDWRLPPDTPIEHARDLTDQRQRRALLEKWPQTPNPALGGQTPEQAAAEPARRVKVLALILSLESSSNIESSDFNELRARLALPAPEDIDPSAMGDDLRANHLSLVRLHRLIASKLSDDDLLYAYQRAALPQAKRALRRIVPEVVSRPSLEQRVDQAQAYGLLASFTQDLEQALDYVERARKAAEASGRSSAEWDMEELMLRLGQGNAPAAERLLKHIQTAHGKEPGVMQRLTQLLYQAGVIDERGRPVGPPAEEPAGIVVPGGPAEAAGKLWTPGGEAGEGKKSALWMPGMD